MQDSDSMDTFWLWLEQQEEQQMCKQVCDNKQGNVKRTPHPHAEVISRLSEV